MPIAKMLGVVLALIFVVSIFGLAAVTDPAVAFTPDNKILNNTYSYNNYDNHALPQMVVFDLPLKQDIKDNTDLIVARSIKELVAMADLYLVEEPVSVMEKERIAPSGDKHDFLSLAPFRWPDYTKPTHVPYIYRDGEINPEIFSVPDRSNLARMIEMVKILGAAYYFTDNILYASKASELLRVWFLNNNTRMNPNLQFAELVTGKNNGTSSGIIAANYFPVVLDSISMIHDSPAWTDEDERGIKLWFEKYLDWLLNSKFGKKESKRLNNHGTWYDVQTSSIAMFLDKPEIVKKIIKNNIETQIAVKIQANGSQTFESPRQRSLDYYIFNLQGFFLLAKIGEYFDTNLWDYMTPEGGGLHVALDYLLPYATSMETWPLKQIKPIKTEALNILLCQAVVHYKDNEHYLQALRSIDQEPNSQINALLYGCASRLAN